MKKIGAYFPILMLITLLFSSCQIVGDIFKAGVWVGIILVVAVIFLIFKMMSGGKS